MRGVPAAKGTVRGIARVLQSSDELHRLEPGSILVCESTSPNWTPAFGKIAGAVCDGGGMLSHAAIVGREYGVPTVTAVGVATMSITDGDEIEVDGTNGTVTILTRAADADSAAAAPAHRGLLGGPRMTTAPAETGARPCPSGTAAKPSPGSTRWRPSRRSRAAARRWAASPSCWPRACRSRRASP